MKKIKDLIKKPSVALKAMYDGLKEQQKRKNFKIDFLYYGDYSPKEKICFGCAATCAVQKIFKKNYSGEEIYNHSSRAGYLNIDPSDLRSFEVAMNDARKGDLRQLFTYLNIDKSECRLEFQYRIRLFNENWEKNLEAVPELITLLEEFDL